MTDLGIPGVGDATLIASGGSALVYQAVSGTGEQLAVKVLRGIRGAEVARRFDREQSAAERLAGHPNIIRIHHSGVTGAGEPYLVMPLVAGGSLSDEIDKNGPLSLARATGDIAQAAEALAYAHDRGVLHRDIKPGNLLRSADGSIIVTDFGIARVVDAGITSATVGASTPLYAAPELLAENDASVQSEVYALAATLYALLNGSAAFSGSDNIWATMTRIRSELPKPIDGVPDPVMRVIEQAMSKEPQDRPSTALQFREHLRTALTATVDWTPPTPTQQLDMGAERDEPESVPVVPPLDRPSATPRAEPTVKPSPAARQSPSPMQAPPVPAFDRPAPAVGSAPRRDASTSKILAATAALILLGGLAWLGTSRLFGGGQIDETTTVAPPVDNSLPSPVETGRDSPQTGNTDAPPTDTTTADEATEEANDGDVSIDDLPAPAEIPNSFVSFSGDHFSALLPEGWSLAARDIEESYGYRSMFVTEGMYLNIDTTPREQRSGGDIAEGARQIASGIRSASEVRTEQVDGLTMHSFTFRNNEGVDSIDIFFEVDGDGYAVVAGSANDPDTAFATARLVALSIRSNPS